MTKLRSLSSAAKSTKSETELTWAQIGENVSTVLAMTRHGEREKVVSAFALTYKTYENRVRKATSAYEYVMSLDDRRLQNALFRQDLSLVDLVGLWASHNRSAALTAARELVEGQHTFRSLLDAERRARPKAKSTVASRSATWKENASDVLLGSKARGYRPCAAPPNLSDTPIDLWFKRGEKFIGVHLLGPYPARRDYSRGMATHVCAALGIASLGPDVWIVMPTNTAADAYKNFAERLAPGVLKVFDIELPLYKDL